MRLFAAVWPPEDVLDHLDLALGSVRRTTGPRDVASVRWSARETWHLTCAFYGEVPDGRVPELARALAAAAAEAAPYRLRLRGAGVFSHRTLWVGVGGETAAQQGLARSAIDAGLSVGTRPDARPRERAHLTVGRVRADERRGGASRGGDARRGIPAAGAVTFDPDAFVGAFAVYEGPAWTVDTVLLVASRPGEGRGGGPLYDVVDRFDLGR